MHTTLSNWLSTYHGPADSVIFTMVLHFIEILHVYDKYLAFNTHKYIK